MSMNDIVPISGSLGDSMRKLFLAGGFALAFGFAGLILMIIASITDSNLQLALFIVGALMTGLCLSYFLYTNLKSRDAVRSITEDLPLLDALQSTAYQAAELANVTQSFAFKHLDRIQTAIETIAPKIEALPVVGPAIKKSGFTDVARLSESIVSATDSTRHTVLQVQEAIRTGDLKGIRQYGTRLGEAVQVLKEALRHQEADHTPEQGERLGSS